MNGWAVKMPTENKISDISERYLVEKIFERGRWYAVLNEPYDGRKKMLFAVYVWLLKNPSFRVIPKGYVIHHLDYDETNDDISNLVIMQKLHHIAHHWKQKEIRPKISFNATIPSKMDLWEYRPNKKPRVRPYNKDEDRWFVALYETFDGKGKERKIYRHNGEVFKTKAAAEKCRDEIWAYAQERQDDGL